MWQGRIRFVWNNLEVVEGGKEETMELEQSDLKWDEYEAIDSKEKDLEAKTEEGIEEVIKKREKRIEES